MMGRRIQSAGFTLIEISIVLVIIGLIVGGVLVGQDLIHAAAVRSQISQIEKYQTAVNTFRDKYGALPGDMNGGTATQYGFAARGSTAGTGNGDGILSDGNNAGNQYGSGQLVGETAMFWSDLTFANGMNLNMIEGTFIAPYEVFSARPCPGLLPLTMLGYWLPYAKIGGGNFVFVFSFSNLKNYFGLAVPTGANCTNLGMSTVAGLTVKDAYSIDVKIDDGQPMTGRVLDAGTGSWTGFPGSGFVPPGDVSGITGSTNSSINCIYRQNPMPEFQYSVNFNGGSGVNCSLAIQFQ